MSEMACYHCGQMGHLRAHCPTLHPAQAPTAPPVTYKRHMETIECPTCHSDWVSTTELLETLLCPWCRKFEVRDDGNIYHRTAGTLR